MEAKMWIKLAWLVCLLHLAATKQPEPPKHRTKVKVIIVGAGASGVAAANRLMSKGVSDILLLEANKHRYGGRIVWKTCEHLGGVDVGDNHIISTIGNTAYDLVSYLNITRPSMDWETPGFMRPDSSNLNLGITYAEWNDLLYNVSRVPSPKDKSTTYLGLTLERVMKFAAKNKLSKQDTKYLKQQAIKDLAVFEGGPLERISLKRSAEFDAGSGETQIEFINGGMTNLLDVLTGKNERSIYKYLDVEKKIVLDSRVVCVDWSKPYVEVKTERGHVYYADYLIFTPSLGVLKEKHSSLFVPPLPHDKQAIIEKLEIDAVTRVHAFFENPFFERNPSGCVALSDKSYPKDTKDLRDSVVSILNERHNKNVLCLTFAGQAAVDVEKLSTHDLKELVIGSIKRYITAGNPIDDPVCITRSRFSSDPDFRGAFSYSSIRSESIGNPREVLGQPICNCDGDPVVMISGEVISKTHYGTVNGAIEAGWYSADTILKNLVKTGTYPGTESYPPKHCDKKPTDRDTTEQSVEVEEEPEKTLRRRRGRI